MEVVIVGNGGVATSAVKTFVAQGLKANITVVSKASTLPYSPVVLPHFIEGKIPRRQMYLLPHKFCAEHGISTLWVRRVASVIARQVAALNIMGFDAQFSGSLLMNTLNIFDVPLAAIGQIEGEQVNYLQ